MALVKWVVVSEGSSVHGKFLTLHYIFILSILKRFILKLESVQVGQELREKENPKQTSHSAGNLTWDSIS